MATVTVDTLRKTITDSGVLTPAEKQEWLRLVEFMNDKQLLDLYKILVPTAGGDARAEVPATVSAPAPPPAAGKIGEGASLSAFLQKTMGKQKTPSVASAPSVPSVPKPPQPKNTPRSKDSPQFEKWKEQFTQALTEKELESPGNGEVALPASSKSVSSSSGAVKAATVLPPPVQSQKTTPVAEPKHKQSEARASAPADPSPPATAQAPHSQSVQHVSIAGLEDVVVVDVGTLRTLGSRNLYDKMRALSKHKGYFDVLFALEKSPLYAAYVRTGMRFIQENFGGWQSLTSQDSATSLTREEFEAMTDMLRNLGMG